MEPGDLARAIDVALATAQAFDLSADHAIVLQNSNKLSLRLLPCNVFARVAPSGHRHARFEVPLARALATHEAPVAALEPRVEPRGDEHDGFEITLWTYYEPTSAEISAGDYADALRRLHVSMREVDIATPHFTDRVGEAEHLVSHPDLTPELSDGDRALLAGTMQRLRQAILASGAVEQLLHGEPHAGNVLSTANGPLFIDLETCCRGPVEFDLAHVPEAVSARYPGLDPARLQDCRELVLAMVASWRWDRADEYPNGRAFGHALLHALQAGPPWPAIDRVFDGLDAPSPTAE